MSEAAFNRAEADDYVVARPQSPGWLAGVLVGQGVHTDVGEIVLDVLGDSIDEFEHRSARAFFRIIAGFAGFALAPIGGVVLGDAHDGRFGVLANPLPHAFLGYLQDVSVRETALYITVFALAFDQRKILG